MLSVAENLVLRLSTTSGCEATKLNRMFKESGMVEREFFDTLVRDEVLSEEACYRTWAKVLGFNFYSLARRELDPAGLHRLPSHVAQQFGAVVVEEGDDWLEVVLLLPYDITAFDTLQEITGKAVIPAISTPSAIQRALNRQERGTGGIEGLLHRLDGISLGSSDMPGSADLQRLAGENAVVQLVDYLIAEATRLEASDIHLEPLRDQFRMRLRTDGQLETIHSFSLDLHAPVISRVKILSGLDISERRRPQDGRFVFTEGSKQIEIRVSTLPTVLGEKVVMRVLDKESILLNLESIGFLAENLENFRKSIHSRHGLVLLTGPTGSGKTTTLYSALHEINSDKINIVTVEDPVEYELRGTSQVQVDNRANRTFANSLRSILRQDPDVAMVGEIRDAETARIAVQAALTGHLVFSTLHTNDAAGAVYRLLDMGIEPYLLGPALRCVVSQRLVPKICTECRSRAEPDPSLLRALQWPDGKTAYGFSRGKGCKACRGRGTRGRVAIHEVIYFDAHLRNLVSLKCRNEELLDAATQDGYQSLMSDGIIKIQMGLITADDLLSAASSD